MQSDFHLAWAQSTFNATPKVDSFVMQFSTSQEHVYWMEIYSNAMLWQKECLYRTSRLHKIDLTALDKIKGLLCHGSVGYTNAAYTNAADSVPVHGVKHGVTGQPHYTAACGMQMYPSNDSICTQSSVKIADSNICKNAWDIQAKFGGASEIQPHRHSILSGFTKQNKTCDYFSHQDGLYSNLCTHQILPTLPAIILAYLAVVKITA